MVAMATAMVGVIAFVGLVVPHVLRLLSPSDYTFLVPASALLGALLMEVIDVVARLVISPAELPIGIITAVVGAPVFLWHPAPAAAPRERRVLWLNCVDAAYRGWAARRSWTTSLRALHRSGST